jgi:hypothetical protein
MERHWIPAQIFIAVIQADGLFVVGSMRKFADLSFRLSTVETNVHMANNNRQPRETRSFLLHLAHDLFRIVDAHL